MTEGIEKLEMPKWLKKDNFNFNLHTVLKDSLYYPCAMSDGYPIKFLMGNVYSFVYNDWGYTESEIKDVMHGKLAKRNPYARPVKGYHIIHEEYIPLEKLIPINKLVRKDRAFYRNRRFQERREWDLFFFEKLLLDFDSDDFKSSFGMWYILERDKEYDESHNPARFSLLFVAGEGVAMYKALYLANEIKPKIIVLIPLGCGVRLTLGVNVSEYSEFDKCLFSREDLLPDYFVGWVLGSLSLEGL